jgi:hypothetical protein
MVNRSTRAFNCFLPLLHAIYYQRSSKIFALLAETKIESREISTAVRRAAPAPPDSEALARREIGATNRLCGVVQGRHGGLGLGYPTRRREARQGGWSGRRAGREPGESRESAGALEAVDGREEFHEIFPVNRKLSR